MIDLETAKTYLKIDNDDSGDVIELLIAAAERKTENYCSTYWEQKEIEETHIGEGTVYLYLYRMPIEEVTKVVIDEVEYTDFTERLSIGMLYGSWPKLSEIVVTYTAGYVEAPDEAKLAVLMCVADWFNNPQGLASINISGIGSTSFGEELDLPDRVKAKLSGLRKRIL
jgi:hypothetical protein